MKPFDLGKALGDKFPNTVDDLMDKYLPKFSVAKFKALPAKKHAEFLDSLYDELAGVRKARPLLPLLEKVTTPAQEKQVILGLLDGVEVEEPAKPAPAKPAAKPAVEKPPVVKPAPATVPPQANKPMRRDEHGIPIVTVSGAIKAKYPKAQAGNTTDRLGFLNMLWKELNETNFENAMVLPTMRFLKDMGSRGRRLAHWNPRLRELGFAPRLFNAPLNVILETMLHEMCHQAVSEITKVKETTNGGHGPNWIRWMVRVGLDPKRYDTNDALVYVPDDEKEAFIKQRQEMEQRRAELENQKETMNRLWRIQPNTPALGAFNGSFTPGLIVCSTNATNTSWAFLPAGSFKVGYYTLSSEVFYELTDADKIALCNTDLMKRLANKISNHFDRVKSLRQARKAFRKLYAVYQS